jgi:hypothetical protein
MVFNPPLLVLTALGLMVAAVGPLDGNEDLGYQMMRYPPPDAQDAATLAAIETGPKCHGTWAVRERMDGGDPIEGYLMACPP